MDWHSPRLGFRVDFVSAPADRLPSILPDIQTMPCTQTATPFGGGSTSDLVLPVSTI
jgi:hypothetical protein